MFSAQIESAIGNTPLVHLNSGIDYYAKLEGLNLFGSMKDRAALYTIKELLSSHQINTSTKIIESSSGNFAIALAGICCCLGISFTCVSDPLMNSTTRELIRAFGAEIITITEPDEHNIFVTKRIEYIKNVLLSDSKYHWINQYDNPYVRNAYGNLANEIITQKPGLEYVFIPVSSCGTIAGISMFMRSIKPSVKIIAVDLQSSSIFFKPTVKQKLPSMGFNTVPGNLCYAYVDDIVIVDELSCIIECRKLLKCGLIVGPSSGAVATAIKKYFGSSGNSSEAVGIFPDKGDRYLSTVFNDNWCLNNYSKFSDIIQKEW